MSAPATTQTIAPFPVSTNTEVSNSSYKNSLEAIRSRHSQELVIGLCGAVGAGVKRLKTALINELENANYHVEHIRLSDLIIQTQSNQEELKALTGYPRYNTLQNLGDQLRKDNSNTTVAEMGIRRIGLIRNALFGKGEETGKAVKVTKKVAYVVDQIKHHEEVELFQEVYPRFQIISATFMGRCRRGSQLLKVVRSSRQRNKQYYHELSAVDRGQKIPDFCSFGTGNFGFRNS